MFKVAILDDYHHEALRLANWKPLDRDAQIQVFSDNLQDAPRLAERLQSFDAVVVMRERTPFRRELFERLPNLRLLVTTGPRNASIDMAAASERGVLVCGTQSTGFPTAELTWGLIFALFRHLPQECQAMREGKWICSTGRSVRGKTLGVVGVGRLGVDVVRVGNAFGMKVIAWSQNLTAERAEAAGATLVTKQQLLEQSDIVTLHVVLSGRTRDLIGKAEFDRMKPTAVLVNTSRGPIVNEQALVEALRTKRIAGAAMDVYDQEPLPPYHPLRSLDNVVLTPHLGYATDDSFVLMWGEAVEDIRAFLDGAPIRIINKPA